MKKIIPLFLILIISLLAGTFAYSQTLGGGVLPPFYIDANGHLNLRQAILHRGDIFVASTTGQLYQLATGTEGQVLKITSGIPGWGLDSTGVSGEGLRVWSTSTIPSAYYLNDVTIGSNSTGSAGFWFATSTNNLIITGSLTASNISVASTTAWNSAYFIVNASSSLWDSAYSKVNSSSTNWDIAYGNVNASSSYWNTAYFKVNASSSYWDSAYFQTNSSSTYWNAGYYGRVAGTSTPGVIWAVNQIGLTARLVDLSGIAPTKGNFIVGNGSNLIAVASGTENQFPVSSSTAASGIAWTSLNTDNWNNAYGWGNHALSGYLTANASTTALSIGSLKNGFLKIGATGLVGTSSIDISDDTNLSGGRSLTMNGDAIDADAELYTKQPTFNFIEATTTEKYKRLSYRTPLAMTIIEIGCYTDSGSSTLAFYEAAEITPNASSSSIINNIECDNNMATTTTIADANVAARNLIVGMVTSVTDSTNTIAWITPTTDD